MRIVVPIKQVPETNAVRMDEETGTMIREGVESIINPLDLYAIELAIRLREEHGGELVVVSRGLPKAITSLREAIAMGCYSAFLVAYEAFAGAFTWATSYVLSGVIKKLGGTGFQPVDLVICGERATDGDTGQVGPGIASFLDLPVATYIGKVDTVAGKSCRVHRLVETGYEVLDVDLPAVLTVVKEVADPRLPTLRGKQKARKMDIPTWTSGDLDVESDKLGLNGSPTRVVKIHKPTVARKCEKLHAGDDESIAGAVDRMVEFLKEKQVL
ncbi:MAG: electron transfer flavoprotein subunit beta/FixA family protein [Phycisphaerae bacterium]|nr:electron transfer flavoprotein subunit beta/FixA family protein [Phycisphaerae bacterium]